MKASSSSSSSSSSDSSDGSDSEEEEKAPAAKKAKVVRAKNLDDSDSKESSDDTEETEVPANAPTKKRKAETAIESSDNRKKASGGKEGDKNKTKIYVRGYDSPRTRRRDSSRDLGTLSLWRAMPQTRSWSWPGLTSWTGLSGSITPIRRRASAVAREEAGAAAAVEDGEVTWEAARLAAAVEDAGATGEVAAAVEGVADEEGTVSAEEGEDRRSTRRRLQ